MPVWGGPAVGSGSHLACCAQFSSQDGCRPGWLAGSGRTGAGLSCPSTGTGAGGEHIWRQVCSKLAARHKGRALLVICIFECTYTPLHLAGESARRTGEARRNVPQVKGSARIDKGKQVGMHDGPLAYRGRYSGTTCTPSQGGTLGTLRAQRLTLSRCPHSTPHLVPARKPSPSALRGLCAPVRSILPSFIPFQCWPTLPSSFATPRYCPALPNGARPAPAGHLGPLRPCSSTAA